MNEIERLAYLDVMGIESYIPRVTLPGALPPVLCDMGGLELIPQESPQGTTRQQTAIGKDSLKGLQDSLGNAKLANQKAIASQKSMVPEPQQRFSSSPAQAATQISVRFNWVIFQPMHRILLLVPAAHTNPNSMQLLKKILAAIGVVDVPLTPLENFIWPSNPTILSQQVTTGNSLADARKALYALLESYQARQKQQQKISYVLVFDENLGKILFDNMSFSELELRILPSLQLMLTSSPEKIAELKQLAWQRLKDLKA